MFHIPLPFVNHSFPACLKIFFFACAFALFFFCSSCTHLVKIPNFTWPVKNPYSLSRYFSIYHEGIDFPKKIGQSVFSSADGEVIYVGTKFSGYGKVILIEHQYAWLSLYAHLNSIEIPQGAKVKRGQKIGTVGNTGRSSGPHLHFELIRRKKPINPLRFLR